jgi:hypothetical protein
MLDKNFIAARFERRGGGFLHSLREANDEARELIGGTLEDKIIGSTPLKDTEVSMLFTYMHRRFGLPSLGGDDYKDLSAGWMITSPVDDLALIVSPSFAGVGFSFMPVVSLPDRDRNGRGLQQIRGDRLRSLANAYERTLLDLLRPVIQRDMSFNVLGEISDENAVPEWADAEDVDDDTYDRLPRYHETCGLPMPDGVFGNKHWQRIMMLFRGMGGGEIAAGMEAFVEEAERRAFHTSKAASEKILPVIAAGFHLAQADEADSKVTKLGLAADDPRISEFCRAAYGNGLSAAPSDWLMSLSGDDILEAIDFVVAFGVGTHQLTKAVENVARSQRYHIEWARFLELSGGEFDEDLIPEVPYITGRATDEWRARLASSGDAALAEWADELAKDEAGRQTLSSILSVLHHRKVMAARAARAPET